MPHREGSLGCGPSSTADSHTLHCQSFITHHIVSSWNHNYHAERAASEARCGGVGVGSPRGSTGKPGVYWDDTKQ